jgi:hypothetical protein
MLVGVHGQGAIYAVFQEGTKSFVLDTALRSIVIGKI